MPEIGQLLVLTTEYSVLWRCRIRDAELHHTKLRPIRPLEVIQGAWRYHRGEYWLLTLEAA